VGKYGVMVLNDHLYYMRARHYDPTIGRFLSEDPIWSTNLYPYADNNPIMGIDPKGMTNEDIARLAQLDSELESFYKALRMQSERIDNCTLSWDDPKLKRMQAKWVAISNKIDELVIEKEQIKAKLLEERNNEIKNLISQHNLGTVPKKGIPSHHYKINPTGLNLGSPLRSSDSEATYRAPYEKATNSLTNMGGTIGHYFVADFWIK
jgi:uncharacterized protein RhaS with RHS repeats